MNRSDQALVAEILAETLGQTEAEWQAFKEEITYPGREAQPQLITLARAVFHQAFVRALDAVAKTAQIPDDMDVFLEAQSDRRKLN